MKRVLEVDAMHGEEGVGGAVIAQGVGARVAGAYQTVVTGSRAREAWTMMRWVGTLAFMQACTPACAVAATLWSSTLVPVKAGCVSICHMQHS